MIGMNRARRPLVRPIRNFFGRLAHVWKWLRIIWGDYDWDHAFLWRILAAKLAFMGEYFETRGALENSEEVAEQIREAYGLALCLFEDKYEDAGFDEIERRWGEAVIEHLPAENPEFRELHISHPNVKTASDELMLRADERRAMEEAEMSRTRDRDALFDLISDHVDSWWS